MADRALVIHAVVVAALSFLAGMAGYPLLIGWLSRHGAGQQVQEYNPESHQAKQGTPTMGGILFVVIVAGAWLVFDRGRAGFVTVFALVAGAALGILDDVANIAGRKSLGLNVREKFALQAFIGLLVGVGLDVVGATRQAFPGLGAPDLQGAGIILLAMVAVVAVSNAVNITDGVDGLAATVSVVVFIGLLAIAVQLHTLPVVVVSAAVVGSLVAFLVFNWYPARIFMGDTGSLAIGCVLVTLAAEERLIWFLPLLGIVFLAETLSVIINVTAVKRFGKRVFRASPLHHHFELLGLRERRLVALFAAAAAVGTLLTVLYARSTGSLA